MHLLDMKIVVRYTIIENVKELQAGAAILHSSRCTVTYRTVTTVT